MQRKYENNQLSVHDLTNLKVNFQIRRKLDSRTALLPPLISFSFLEGKGMIVGWVY